MFAAAIALTFPLSGVAGQSQQAAGAASAQVSKDFLKSAARHGGGRRPDSIKTSSVKKSGVPGIDSLANFVDQFTADGFDTDGNPQSVWPYSMVGAAPESNRTTVFNAPVIPVVVELLGPNGQVLTFNGTVLRQRVTPEILSGVLNSPIFEPFSFGSGRGQFTDQMMRAQFWNRIGHGDSERGDDDEDGSGYHNILRPSVKTTRTIRLPLGKFFFALNDDGSCCLFVLAEENAFLNAVFPATATDTTTVIGAAENAGEMKTRDITTLLFNNVYLYQGNVGNCCVLGFHSYDLEPGDAKNGFREKRYVMNYSSWIANGLFSFGFEDVTALSHEMAELFADPFVDDETPWWLSVDPFFGFSLCQNNLETGDVIEVLTGNPVFAASTRQRTYHLQNEALLPWFAFQSPSPARLHAYSFPDETTLTTLSPHPLLPGCKTP
jgi:hypothetical protein